MCPIANKKFLLNSNESLLKADMNTPHFHGGIVIHLDTCSVAAAGGRGRSVMILRGVGGAAKHRFSYLEKRAKKGLVSEGRKEGRNHNEKV